ncbi:MAG TPA: multifunctional CCA tRNA nucleotidyl transferase/2'3'-cyclic phosphodiesterase/2'nucleotidase/phosphatase [Gammaproteobacteria bacterium]
MKTYLVGGAVRDKLLGLTPKERDWVVVGGTATEILALGYTQVGQNFPVFLHPQSKEEYALARSERKTGRGHKGFEFDSSADITLEEDLQRRDLTINAMAEDENGRIIDPYNGLRDLQNRVLRHVSAAFTEDPLRVLRVARFMSQLGEFNFQVATETLELMQRIVAAGEIKHLVAERIWQELHKALQGRTPQRFLQTLQQSHALAELFPAQNFDFDKAVTALQQAALLSKDTHVRYAAMMTGADTSATIVAIGDHLRIPKAFTELAELLRSQHDFFINSIQLPPPDILEGLKQLDAFRRPERFEQFLLAAETACRATNNRESWPVPQREYLHTALAQARAINGKDLTKLRLEGEELAKELDTHRRAAISKVKRTYRWAKFN